jgi:CheY-like chemotaxis protein
MEAIGELAGGIAQDFNNMLHAIDGTLDAFESEPGCTRVHHALINEIRGVTSRATQTTRQLLSFARRGQFQSVPVDMHSLLNETRRLLVSAADRRIQIITAFHAANRTVLGDPVQIQTTILHLGLNARDAMPRGGILTMATRNTREEGTDGERLEITVADTGVGMTPEIMSHIFEPFFTTKKQGEGTGMGLAGVYGCITGLNGRISVRSEPGKGSVFTIDLPLYEGAVEPVPETQPAAASSATGHVMVVDDEEIVRNATARVLTHLGYRVTVCADGEEALRLFLQKADEFDLVILDMMMPNMNGEETFRRMREEDPNVRVLVASGFSRDETVDRMLANGARGFLSKPFRVSELSMQIQRHVRVRPKSPV